MLRDRLHAWWLIQSRLTTLQTSLIARRWVGPPTYGFKLEPNSKREYESSMAVVYCYSFVVGLKSE